MQSINWIKWQLTLKILVLFTGKKEKGKTLRKERNGICLSIVKPKPINYGGQVKSPGCAQTFLRKAVPIHLSIRI